MNKFYTLLFFLLFTALSFSQIRGKVTAKSGEILPYVSILVANTYNGSSSNDLGNYEINIREKGKYTLIFQSLGYKTKKITIDVTAFPHQLDVELEDENFTLDEVVISNQENPANAIIKKAVASKKINSAKTDKFKADFYSRGIFRVKDMPKKIMGVEVGDFDGTLDSTRTGILYLSETVSKIIYQKPDKIKEEIIASKVSGNDNGFSFNTASETDYDFYDNYVDFNINMVSPIANNAFNYYKYKLEGSFYDDNNNQINKIKVIAKRDKEPVFEGYIYIVEDSWAIYAVDLEVLGYRAQQPIMEKMTITQNYNYNTQTKMWVKNLQTLDFSAGIFGIQFTGKFTHVFSNYEFKDAFEKKTFSREIATFAADSNKKEDSYWDTYRPVPLTEEEVADYKKKDSIQTIRKSSVYLDSIDAKGNKFKVRKILTGYTYTNTFKKTRFNYEGLLNIGSLGFNTVQGWNFGTGFSFRKYDESTGKSSAASVNFNYGVAEDRLRVIGAFSHRFNTKNYASFSISGGSKAEQFNSNEPIINIVNSVSTLFFKDNYMKLYNKEFLQFVYGQEVVNGIYASAKVEYSARKPLFNNTDYVLIKNDKEYTSNNPLAPNDYSTPAFSKHNLVKATIGTRIRFAQDYITRPDGKMNIPNSKYPTLSLAYEKGLAGSEDRYNYDLIAGTVSYRTTIGNKGDFGINIKGGKFFNAENIAFMDYKHFNGNQTHVGLTGNYLNSFNLMPYYTHSTNDAYFEFHAEHNFKGYIMNKIPLLNQLQWNLIIGAHQAATPDYKPYQEFTVGFDNVGFGKFRVFRVDYVRSYQGGFLADGIIVGFKFGGLLD